MLGWSDYYCRQNNNNNNKSTYYYVVAAFPKLIHSRQDALVGGGKKNQVNIGNSI